MPSRTRLVALLLFGSGFCALIYQTTWLREFRLIFGASTAASAAVLGVFMGGLGFGGIILGKRAETRTQPLAFYAQLELLIALSAALSPLLIWLARHLYIALGGTLSMGMAMGTIMRLILTAIIIGAPTFLMGGTLPAAVRAVVAPDDVSRRAVGTLYGVNTLGAVTGALLGTFYLFEHFGNQLTLWSAVVVNVVVALAALRLSRLNNAADTAATTGLQRSHAAETAAATSPRFVFIAAGVVGFAFFLMEIVWYRMLGPLLGGSTFSFGLILAAALFGIGAGGVAYAMFDLKRSGSLRVFALSCAAEALFIALPYAFGDRIAIAAMLLRPLGALGFYGHVIAWSAICFVVVVPAAFVAGVQFPLLIALLGKGRTHVGSQTGAAYAWNTLGALTGSIAGGFGLIPFLSAPGVWKLVIIILSLLAIASAIFPSRESRRWSGAVIPISVGALALAMLTAIGPTAFWRHSQVGVGSLKHYQMSPNETRDLVSRFRRHIMWQKDGIESSVGLDNADSLSFVVNGKSDGNAKLDAGTQLMCGLISATLHPNPQRAMVVGLGSGSTAGWLASVPTMERVDVVELEPAILKVAELCAPANGDALTNPKVRVIIGDGRELFLTIREQYDLIASEPSNPYRAGVASLFTREFYQSVERRLNRGGIFSQWLQTYDVDDRTIGIFFRTLASVFANVEAWQTEGGDLLLVASRDPINYDADFLRRRLADEPFRSAVAAAWNGNGLEDFLAHYVGNNTITRTFPELGKSPLNTDDRTAIEFALAKSVGAANGFRIASLSAAAHASQCDRPKIAGEIDWEQVEEARFVASGPSQRDEQPQTISTEQQHRYEAIATYMKGDWDGALRSWRAQSQEPKSLFQQAMLAECLAAAGDDDANRYIDQFAPFLPGDAEATRAILYWRQRKRQEAIESLKKFFQLAHENPWPDSIRIVRSLSLAETVAKSNESPEAAQSLYEILKTPFCLWNNEIDRLKGLFSIAMHLDGDTPGERTAAAIAQYEPNVPWDRGFLEARKSCYAATRDPRAGQAARDLDEFLRHESLTSDVSSLKKEFENRGRKGGN